MPAGPLYYLDATENFGCALRAHGDLEHFEYFSPHVRCVTRSSDGGLEWFRCNFEYLSRGNYTVTGIRSSRNPHLINPDVLNTNSPDFDFFETQKKSSPNLFRG